MSIDLEIRQAIEFEGDTKEPVLSVYLDVDSQRRSPEQFKAALRTLLNQVKEAPAEDVKRIQNYIEMGYNRQGRSVVLFSCSARDFWWAKSFMAPVEDAVFLGRRPNVRQLAMLLDTYSRYGVIHVDQEGARLYLFHMGELESVEGHLGEEIKLHKAGGWSAPRFQRHESGVARHNLQEAAETAEEFYRNIDTRRLLLAGTEKNVARFQALLSNRLRQMVVGGISVTANATPASISQKALEMVRKSAEAEAAAKAGAIVENIRRGGLAVAGLAETLTAVQEGRASHVAVISSFAQPAYRFEESGTILLELDEDAEFGSGKLQELPDAVESVLRRAMVQGIDVTIVDSYPELEKLGSIAAQTRY
jgi:peptide chain release factor subunit 1